MERGRREEARLREQIQKMKQEIRNLQMSIVATEMANRKEDLEIQKYKIQIATLETVIMLLHDAKRITERNDFGDDIQRYKMLIQDYKEQIKRLEEVEKIEVNIRGF